MFLVDIFELYRVGAGRALTIDTRLQLALSINIRRPIKDNYATLYSSFIFPKGSPLVVSNILWAPLNVTLLGPAYFVTLTRMSH